MKSTKVRTHEDHALLLLPETATLSQMEHKSMPRFLNVKALWKTYSRRKRPPFQEQTCLYCGKPGHMARACNKKKENDARPRNPVTTRATTTQEEAPLDDEDDSSSHIASLYHDVYAGTLPTRPFSAPIPEDF